MSSGRKIGYIAAQRIKGMKGEHINWDTEDDDKTIRLNSRDYVATSGNFIGFQAKPAIAADGTAEIKGCEISPRVKDTFGCDTMIGVLSDCILKGTSGNLTGRLCSFQGQLTDENSAGRTITGVASILDAWHQLAGHTFTGGVYVINVRAAGGATPWSGFAVLPDDGQIATDTGTPGVVTGATGWIKVMVGSATRYIALTDSVS